MIKIAFIGAGNMARAIIIGLVKSGVAPQSIMVANPSSQKRLALAEDFGVQQTNDNIAAAEFANVIVLSVKPHFISDVCQQIATAHVNKVIDIKDKTFISVAAGTTVAQIQQALNGNYPVIRVMPNTPSQVGLGMSGLFASAEVSDAEKAVSEKLMNAVGKSIWLQTEAQIDDIIAVAGSAPAYFFLFMEAMEKQAQQLGFNAQESRMLVEQTALGAAQMVAQNNIPISQLRENVTSKGGTTQAALKQFTDDGLETLVANAMNAAIMRAKEMAKLEPRN
ncbi:MAG: pyrroline-5-carboxylate reductase [Alteromonadaceae bacterium]|nr:pyrroline-5-carboxylate reductase [Alteromonadaceae bacterium]